MQRGGSLKIKYKSWVGKNEIKVWRKEQKNQRNLIDIKEEAFSETIKTSIERVFV